MLFTSPTSLKNILTQRTQRHKDLNFVFLSETPTNPENTGDLLF